MDGGERERGREVEREKEGRGTERREGEKETEREKGEKERKTGRKGGAGEVWTGVMPSQPSLPLPQRSSSCPHVHAFIKNLFSIPNLNAIC